MWRIKATIYILWWIVKGMSMAGYPSWFTRKIVIRSAWQTWKSHATFDPNKGISLEEWKEKYVSTVKKEK